MRNKYSVTATEDDLGYCVAKYHSVSNHIAVSNYIHLGQALLAAGFDAVAFCPSVVIYEFGVAR
jgi:hypothetical protein